MSVPVWLSWEHSGLGVLVVAAGNLLWPAHELHQRLWFFCVSSRVPDMWGEALGPIWALGKQARATSSAPLSWAPRS